MEEAISENSTYSVQLLMMICEKKMKANQYHTKDVLTALCYTFLHIYLNNNSNNSSSTNNNSHNNNNNNSHNNNNNNRIVRYSI